MGDRCLAAFACADNDGQLGKVVDWEGWLESGDVMIKRRGRRLEKFERDSFTLGQGGTRILLRNGSRGSAAQRLLSVSGEQP